MTGRYKRKDGTEFDVIQGKKGLEAGNVSTIGRNRLFFPVTKQDLEADLTLNLIEKIS